MRTAQTGRQVFEVPPPAAEQGLLIAVRPAAIVLAATALALLVLVALVEIGPLTHHMSVHILLMGLAAPAIAFATSGHRRLAWLGSGRSLALSSALQIAVLWGWHTPSVLDAAMAEPALHAAMLLSTTAVAIWFWSAVLAAVERGHGWQPIAALAVTAKLFCVPAAILVFANRPLYSCASSVMCNGAAPSLDDQHLAGLLMLTACPLTYLTAGVVIAAHWLRRLRRRSGFSRPAHPWEA